MTFKIHSHKEFTELQTDRDNVLAKLTASENEVNNLKDMSVEMTTKQAEHDTVIANLKAEHQTAIDTLKADYEKQISTLNEQVKVEANASESKAITELAKIGVPAAELPKVTEDNSASILANMSGMSPAELSQYFNQNKKAVFDALRKKTATKKD